jgi:four helix bundle protein
MLRIYPVIVETIRELRGVVQQLRRKDADLCRQLTRSASSMALNTAEGMHGRGRMRAARYQIALGSAREVLACLEVADAFGYVRLDDELVTRMNHVIGTLYRLVDTG